MQEREFSDEEFDVLDLAIEDSFPFAQLVWLGPNERRAEQAQEALLGLLHRGYIEIHERDESVRPPGRRVLRPAAAETAIRSAENWPDPLEEGPDEDRWYEAFATEPGLFAYRRACAERHE